MSDDKHIPNFSQLSEEEKRSLVRSLIASERKNREPVEKEEISESQKILAFFGLPAEANPRKLSRFPVVTVFTVLATAMVSLLAWLDHELFLTLAFIPSDMFRFGGLNMLSCFLVHGDVFHLASNMYAFFIFGDNSEDVLGRSRFFILILTSTLVASIFSGVISSHESIPHVGASGGVFGVIVFYLFRFPKAKFTYLIFYRFVQFPAIGVLALYAATQVIGALQQVSGVGHIDYLAHLGGGLTGYLFWIFNGRNSEESHKKEAQDPWV